MPANGHSEVQEQDSVVGLEHLKPIWITREKTASTGVHFLLHFLLHFSPLFVLLPAGFEHCVPYHPLSILLAGQQGGGELGVVGRLMDMGEGGAARVPKPQRWLTQLGRG